MFDGQPPRTTCSGSVPPCWPIEVERHSARVCHAARAQDLIFGARIAGMAPTLSSVDQILAERPELERRGVFGVCVWLASTRPMNAQSRQAKQIA